MDRAHRFFDMLLCFGFSVLFGLSSLFFIAGLVAMAFFPDMAIAPHPKVPMSQIQILLVLLAGIGGTSGLALVLYIGGMNAKERGCMFRLK